MVAIFQKVCLAPNVFEEFHWSESVSPPGAALPGHLLPPPTAIQSKQIQDVCAHEGVFCSVLLFVSSLLSDLNRLFLS